MRILFASIEWPFEDQPYRGPFAKNLADALQAHFEVIPFPLPVRRNPLNILRYRYQLHQAYHKYQCDHLHCYSLHTLWMANPQKQAVSTSAIGTDVFGSPDQQGLYPRGGSWTYRLLNTPLKHLKGIRAVSETLKLNLQQKVPDSVPIEVIPDGIRVDHFPVKSREAACQKLGWDPDQIHVFFPGNPERAVKNFSLARSLVKPLQTTLNLILHTNPALCPEAMNNYYRAADVVLITSFHEGSSNALKEALLCQTPVISTDAGDAADWLSYSSRGALIPFNVRLEAFENLVRHFSALKRSEKPGMDRSIADKTSVKAKARDFAAWITALNDGSAH